LVFGVRRVHETLARLVKDKLRALLGCGDFGAMAQRGPVDPTTPEKKRMK
jgi:hypothetical protein